MRITAAQRTQRQGVVLLVVIVLLSLFAAVALSFVFYAEAIVTASNATRSSETTARPDVDPELLLSYFLSQLVYDTTNPYSGMRGHSLARSLYGLAQASGTVANVTNANPMVVTTAGPHGFQIGQTGYYVSITNVGGVAVANNLWQITVTGANTFTLPADGSGPAYTSGGTWQLVDFNTTPFNGLGWLGYTDAPSPAGTGLNNQSMVNYTFFASDNFKQRDPEFYGRQGDANYRYIGGANVPYTYPDLNNMFLAAVNGKGEVLMPSFYRGWTGVTFDPTSLDPTKANYNNSKYLIQRPHPSYHLNFPSLPFFAKSNLAKPTDGQPMDADVRNLDYSPGWKLPDGTYAANDSFWMDLGFPVMTLPDGTKYRPLFAPLVVDLDGRVNLWTSGNKDGLSNQGFGPPEINPSYAIGGDLNNLLQLRYNTAKASNITYPLAQRYPAATTQPGGPFYSLINFLPGSTTAPLALPASSGGAITAASNVSPIVITSAGHGMQSGSSVTISGVGGNTAANGTFTITKIDADNFSIPIAGNAAYTSGGGWRTGSTGFIQVFPTYGPAPGWDNALTTATPNPLLINNLAFNYFNPGAGDNPGPRAQQMEAILRYMGRNGPNTTSDVMRALSGSLTAPTSRARNLVTTLSQHFDRPTGSPYLFFDPSQTTGFTQASASISNATNAKPIVISSVGHGLKDGNVVTVQKALGNTAANGSWVASVIDADSFSLKNSDGAASGAYDNSQPGNWTAVCYSVPWSTVTGASNTNPIVVTTSAPHSLQNNDVVTISGVMGNDAANGTFPISFIDTKNYAIPAAGNGAWTSGGVHMALKFPALSAALYTPIFGSTTTALPAASDFQPDGRSLLPQRLRTNVYNPNLPDYPLPDQTTGSIDPTSAAYTNAVTARQKLAQDIYNQFVLVTGTPDPNNKSSSVDPTSWQYAGSRWIAQLAVNIVDYIDNDDYMTPFNWNAAAVANNPGVPGLNSEWLFGTEIPRLLLNEAYVQYDNDPGDPGLATSTATTNYNLNLWVELLNPMRAMTGDLSRDNGDVKLVINVNGTNQSAWQIVASDQDPNLRNPANVMGTPANPHRIPADAYNGLPGSVYMGKTEPNFDWGGVTTVKVFSTSDALSSTAAVGSNTGFYVLGPTTTFPKLPNNRDPKLTSTATSAHMSYPYGLNAPLTKPTIILQRLANPRIAYQNDPKTANYNPYITVDYMENVAINDNRVALPAGANNPGPVTSFYSMGRKQPYAAYSDPRYTVTITGGPTGGNFTLTVGTKTTANLTYNAGAPVVQSALKTSGAPAATVTGPSGGPYIIAFAADIYNQVVSADGTGLTGGTAPGVTVSTPPANQLVAQNPLTKPAASPLHTFFSHNIEDPAMVDPTQPAPANTKSNTLTLPFDWLVHLDRPPVNVFELLHVSAYHPHELTQQFIYPDNNNNPQKFQHYAPWTDQTTLISRALELLGGSSRMNGSFAGGREQGRINLNSVWDEETFLALTDPQAGKLGGFGQIDARGVFQTLMKSRSPSGIPGPPAGIGPGDRPFKSLLAGYVPASAISFDGQFGPAGVGINDTLLRNTGNPGIPNLQFAYKGGSSHSYVQMQMLQKIGNNVTTTSNCFAVWMTVGFFQVDDSVLPAKLGAELGRSENKQVRHRFFAIVDRSELSLFRTTGSYAAPPDTTSTGTLTVTAPPGGSLPNLPKTVQLLLEVSNGTTTEVVTVPATVPAAADIPASAASWTFSVNMQSIPPGTAPVSVRIVCRGNPGPQPSYNPRNDRLVVPHYTVIE